MASTMQHACTVALRPGQLAYRSLARQDFRQRPGAQLQCARTPLVVCQHYLNPLRSEPTSDSDNRCYFRSLTLEGVFGQCNSVLRHHSHLESASSLALGGADRAITLRICRTPRGNISQKGPLRATAASQPSKGAILAPASRVIGPARRKRDDASAIAKVNSSVRLSPRSSATTDVAGNKPMQGHATVVLANCSEMADLRRAKSGPAMAWRDVLADMPHIGMSPARLSDDAG